MIQHQVVEYLLLPDEREPLEKELKRLADQRRQALGGHILKGDAVLLPDVAHEARDLRVIGHGGELCADA